MISYIAGIFGIIVGVAILSWIIELSLRRKNNTEKDARNNIIASVVFASMIYAIINFKNIIFIIIGALITIWIRFIKFKRSQEKKDKFQKGFIKVSIIIGILVFTIIAFIFLFKNNIKPNELSADILKELSKKDILDDSESEENPSFEFEIEKYYKTYKNPYVIHLRKALDGYLNNSNEGMQIPEIVIESQMIDGEQYGLSSFDKSYFKSKFIVFYIDQADIGGMIIDILFQDNPDKIFRAWIYQLADGEYDLRGFWALNISDEKLAQLVSDFEQFIQDKEYAL